MPTSDVTMVIGAEDKATPILNNVASKVSGFASSFATLGPVVAGVTAAVGAVTAAFSGASAAVDAVVASANKIDALTDVATGLGSSVGDLQAFQFAMQEAGNVDAEKSVQSLQKMQRIVGDVATGGNDAAGKIFAQLGLDAEELSMQNPIDQFMQVKAAIGGIENISERAAVAQQLLGKSASDLIPALISEQSEFEASMQAANAFGLTVSEEGAVGIAAMNDALGRVSGGLEGLANQAAVALAPVIESIANTINEWIPPLITIADSTLPILVDLGVQFAGYAYDAMQAFNKIQNMDFSGAAAALNANTADALMEKVNASRQRASEQAIANEERRNAVAAAGRHIDEEALKAQAKKNEDTEKMLAGLERQLQVARLGEEAVKQQEQLAMARNDAERERIALLQEQIDKQEEQNELAKKLDEDSKKQQEEDAKKEQQRLDAAKKPTTLTATESRIMSRGPQEGPINALVTEAKNQSKIQTDTLKAIDESNRLLRERGTSLQLELIA